MTHLLATAVAGTRARHMHTTEQLKTALADRYEIERHVGEGGMATVYLARDVRHNRKVALKVLKADLGAVLGPERFLSEIEVTANLQHPNLLPLFDSGAVGGLLFYVMPFIDGESLRARLEREKQLPIEDAVRIATSVASALDYAHRHGVIHRDLKPENILLHDGQPLVADFGIALAVSNAGGNRITQTGLSLGTPQYMSPEQATGDRQIDARSDIYSLGAMTYEMLTGDAPHVGSTSQAIIARVLTETPRRIRVSRPNVPEHIEAAVFRALEKLAADRWATPKEFAEALAGQRPVTMPSTAATESHAAPALTRSRVAPRRAAGIAAAAAIGLIAGFALRPNRAAAPAVPIEFEVQLPESLNVGLVGPSPVMAMSRDGSLLVFQGVRPGSPPALYSRRLGDRAVQMIRGTEGGRYPVLSPDESELLFLPATGGGGLRRVSINGGTPRTVVDSAQPAAWTDKGDIIYEWQSRIWMVSPDGGVSRLIAAPDSSRGFVHYQFPHALPGGNAVLIGIRRGVNVADSTVIGVVTIPEGKVTELPIRGLSPRYSATGHIVYATQDNLLFAVPFSPRTLRVTGAPIALAEGVFVAQSGGSTFAASGNGTIAYVSGGTDLAGGRRLVAVTRAGVERPLALKPGYYQTPRVSLDGRQIAVTAFTGPSAAPGAPGPNPDIWRYDLGSDALNRVTTDSASAWPEWSAEGDQIAYAIGGRGRRDSAAYMRPLYRTGTPMPVFRAPKGVVIDISIGRTRGYVAAQVLLGPQRNDIYIAHIDSLSAARPLLDAPYNETMPSISPDGRWIAFVTNKTGSPQVYVRALLGGPEVLVSNEVSGEPVWAPNSRELFYRVRTGPFMSAKLATSPRLDVTSRDSLFADTYTRSARANYDVFPGGNEFVFVKQIAAAAVATMPLIVIVNWNARSAAAQR